MALPVNKRVPKILFILFVVAFCVYLVPRVAINFFYYPDDKIYGPDPWSAESVEFTAKDGTRLQGWFIPSSTGPADNARRRRNKPALQTSTVLSRKFDGRCQQGPSKKE